MSINKQKQKEFHRRVKLHQLWLKNPSKGHRGFWHERLEDVIVSEEYSLQDFDFSGSVLINVGLSKVCLAEVDFSFCSFRNVNFEDCNLENAILPPYKILPEKGQFHGFKSVKVNCGGYKTAVIELLIPASAKRVNPLCFKQEHERKCRCSKAKVIGVVTEKYKDQKIFYSLYDSAFKYEVGTWVEVKNFSSDITTDCTPGIHFFLTQKEAENY
jgi:hypothetical protein